MIACQFPNGCLDLQPSLKMNRMLKLNKICLNIYQKLWKIVMTLDGGAGKGAHAVLLCKMEKGRLSWSETNKIDRIRRAYAHKVQNPGTGNQNSKRMGSKDQPTPCKFYQKSTCSHKTDHETNGHMYLHVCSFCFTNGKKFPHD